MLDYAMEFASLSNYNGVLTDTNKVNKGILMDVYNTILTSGIHSNGGSFYHPDYLDSLWQVQRQPGIITLCGLYYNYSRFKDNALSSNLITVNSDRFFDRFVNGVWQNPYQTQTVFAISPPLHSYAGKNFKVVLPTNLWLTNNGTSVSNIAVNFNDGTGYRTVVQGQQLTVNYADTGNKVWTFKLTLTNGNLLYSHTEMQVRPEPNNYAGGAAARFLRPEGPILLTADAGWNGQTAQGWITVDYANPADVQGRFRLNRPLIVAEGFDPGHLLTPEQQFGITDFNSFIEQLENGENLQTLLQSNNQVYDIIYVDWARGTDFLQRNALLLERVIRWVNEQKALDGSIQPNTVLGQSMGGVIARWALRDMENRGLPHQTNLYINWDGPQLGANVPMAYQHMGRHANSFYLSTNLGIAITGYNSFIRPVVNFNINAINGIRGLFGGTPWNEIGSLPANSTILAGLNLSDVPAARQMLINRINLAGNIENNLSTAWQTELRNLGYPQQTRNIAVSNGSECAINQGFAPYADLLTFNGKANTRFLGDILGTIGMPFFGALLNKPQFFLGILPGRNEFFFDFNCKAQPNSGTPLLYKGKITYRKKLLYFIDVNTIITDRTRNAFANVLPIDGSQGGMYDTEINLNSGDFKNWAIKYSITANSIPHFNFIPTPSALGIGNGQTTLIIANYNARYVGALPPLPPLNSPFTNFTTAFGQTEISNGNFNNNEDHIQISPRNGNFVAAELDRLRINPGAIPPVTNCSAFCANGAITGNTNICNPQTLTAPFGNGVTYIWSVNSPIVILAPNGNTVGVSRNGPSNGQAIVSVQISGDCGSTTLTIPITAGTLTPTYTICGYSPAQTCRYGQILMSVTSQYPSGTIYKFYKDNILKKSSTVKNCSFVSSGCNVPMELSVIVESACGNSFPAGESIAFECSNLRVAVSPNPVNTTLGIVFLIHNNSETFLMQEGQALKPLHSLNSTGATIVTLYEFNTSLQVRQWTQNETNSKGYNYNVAGLRKGFYVLQVDRNNQTATTKIIVE